MSNNLRHWSDLSVTDPAYTKPFQRSGGFRGTDINPVWRMKRLTERFGPVGFGWGMTKPEFNLVNEDAGTVVYCTVGVWYRDGDQRSEPFWGVGGDVVSGSRKDGSPFADDEACKKAYTDALGNAMKVLGVSADVFLKQFEDSKYRAEAAAYHSNERVGTIEAGAVAALEEEVDLDLLRVETGEQLNALWQRHGKRITGVKPIDAAAYARLVGAFARRKTALANEAAT